MSNGLSNVWLEFRKKEQTNETIRTEKMMAEDFMNLLKDINLQILQDAYHVTMRKNMKETTL